MKLDTLKLAKAARRRGVSLIEGVLYLIVALAILVAGIVFFNQAVMSRQVNATSTMMTSVSAFLIDSLRESSSTEQNPFFESDASPTEYAIKAGAVPAEMIGTDGFTIRDPWGGVVTFYEAAAEIGARRIPILAARLNDIPANACMRLGHKNAGGDTPVGLDVLAVAVEDNAQVAFDNEWIEGSEIYRVEGNQETDFSRLSAACENGHDLVIYYAVAGQPDFIPSVTPGFPVGFPGGPGGPILPGPFPPGFPGGPGGPGDPEDFCFNHDGMPEPCDEEPFEPEECWNRFEEIVPCENEFERPGRDEDEFFEGRPRDRG